MLKNIHLKWYADDADLLRILCHLHQLGADSPSNLMKTPPRFIGLLYDSKLNVEAARVVLMVARLCEALASMQTGTKPFAPVQVSSMA